MRRMFFGLVLCGLWVMVPAWATEVSPKGAKPLAEADIAQRMAKRGAELERLQQDVAAQESKSREADQKMQQQDKTIAELQRQLRELKGASAASRGQP
ncbi:hypothetical protein [Dyella subtropica]|uniref:hypothetical protein n=1 Tax=Dyella subtropica TaxID=2992127 RepID=UPI00224CC36B|nr:hypothetical protein [Dyella subtropica]